MKRRLRSISAAALVACVAGLGGTTAMAEPPAGPQCADIQWNAELLKSFPRAAVVCQEVVVRNGKKYARFTAKVTAVEPKVVTVRFLTPAGNEERELSLRPGADSRVEMKGKKVEYSTLHKGDVLTFWVPERQLGVISDPDDTAASTILLD
jgi:hypothetical protein